MTWRLRVLRARRVDERGDVGTGKAVGLAGLVVGEGADVLCCCLDALSDAQSRSCSKVAPACLVGELIARATLSLCGR